MAVLSNVIFIKDVILLTGAALAFAYVGEIILAEPHVADCHRAAIGNYSALGRPLALLGSVWGRRNEHEGSLRRL